MMRNVLTLLTVFLLVTAFVANVLADVPADVRADVRADDGPFRFDFEEVAPDVWVGVRADTFRWPVMGNVTFVVSDEGVVVFDGGGMPTMADQVIAKIRALTEAPVTHVITSHWHGDHNFGVFRYGEEWPGIEFIAHRFTREVMQSARINYVDREQGFMERNRDEFERIVQTGVNSEGEEVSAADRAIYAQMLADSVAVEQEFPRARVTPPNVLVDEHYEIVSGDRRIEIRFMGHGNTDGDLVMWLPDERIVATGDIVVAPSPFAFNVAPRRWAATLRAIRKLDYAALVPGHGAVQRNTDYVDLLIETAETIADQRDALVANGVATDDIPDRLDFSAFEERFTGGDAYVKVFYENYMVQAFSAAAVKALGDGRMVEPPPAENVPFDDERWQFLGNEHEVVEHLGRTALRMKGAAALLPELEIRNGVVEFDIAVSGERGFAGALFRYLGAGNSEHFYIRPHQSGNPDANQYQPLFNGGDAWQLYHGDGYGAPVEYRLNEWLPVKIVFAGSQAEIYIDSADPVIHVRDLKRDVAAGAIGLMSANFGDAHFSNFRYTVLADAYAFAQPPQVERVPGMIASWQISDAVSSATIDARSRLDSDWLAARSWSTAAAEASGIVNLSAHAARDAANDTVLARLVLEADAAGTRELQFGYSDRAAVYLNGRLLYRGDNTYMSRDYRYLGTIGLFDSIALPLEPGENELIIAVSESFGGWGLMGRLMPVE